MNTRQRKKKTKYWFNDKERINADVTAAEFLYHLLKEFKKVNKHSLPLGMDRDYWDNQIDQMIWSFNQLRKGYPDAPLPGDFKEIENYKRSALTYKKAVDEGFEAFGKYVGELWD